MNCYTDYLNSLSDKFRETYVDLDELLTMKKLYQILSNKTQIEKLDKIIEYFINLNENNKSQFFSNLFVHEDYIETVLWKGRVKESLDTNFFMGRAFLELGKVEIGLDCLLNYIKMHDSLKWYRLGITNGKNYKASAHFYLGKTYLDLNNRKHAIEHFQKCNSIMNGQHQKAKEYLELLGILI